MAGGPSAWGLAAPEAFRLDVMKWAMQLALPHASGWLQVHETTPPAGSEMPSHFIYDHQGYVPLK